MQQDDKKHTISFLLNILREWKQGMPFHEHPTSSVLDTEWLKKTTNTPARKENFFQVQKLPFTCLCCCCYSMYYLVMYISITKVNYSYIANNSISPLNKNVSSFQPQMWQGWIKKNFLWWNYSSHLCTAIKYIHTYIISLHYFLICFPKK